MTGIAALRGAARFARAAAALVRAIAPERAGLPPRDRRRFDGLLARLGAPGACGGARQLAERVVDYVGRDARRRAVVVHVGGRAARRLVPTAVRPRDPARSDAWRALLLATAALSPAGVRRLGHLAFVDDALVGSLWREASERFPGGCLPRRRTALSPGPLLRRLAAEPRLRRAAGRALGHPLVPADLVVYLHEPPRSRQSPHLDASRYEVIVHLILAHALPRDGSRGSALVVHRPAGHPTRIHLAPGEAVVLGGRGSVHQWEPLGAGERRTMIAIGFRCRRPATTARAARRGASRRSSRA